jgi:hypothetical protein
MEHFGNAIFLIILLIVLLVDLEKIRLINFFSVSEQEA